MNTRKDSLARIKIIPPCTESTEFAGVSRRKMVFPSKKNIDAYPP